MLIRFSRRRREAPETGWGDPAVRESRSWVVWVMGGFLLLLAGGAQGIWWLRSGEEHHVDKAAPAADTDTLCEGLEASEAVARAFLAENDPAKRLQWVRNAEEWKARLPEYPDEARGEVGEFACLTLTIFSQIMRFAARGVLSASVPRNVPQTSPLI